MNESILKALMRLFAMIASFNPDELNENARKIVEAYLSLMLNTENAQQYLMLFDEHLDEHNKKSKQGDRKAKKRHSMNAVKVLMICQEINETLQQEEKIIVVIRLFEFIREDGEISPEEIDFVQTVSETFNIETEEYLNIKSLVIGSIEEITDKEKVLIVDNEKQIQENTKETVQNQERRIYEKQINGKIKMLYLKSTNTFVFRYSGEDSLFLNSMNILPERTYVFDDGAVIKSPKISPIYHSDVAGKFIHSLSKTKIIFQAKDIEFYFKNSSNGVQKFTFIEESGRLISIMGGSGVGKSTLLNVFNGSYKVQAGEITINGYDLYKDKDKLEGVIGFVPQDDLLIEELTVYQNLYYNAKLCFDNFNDTQIKEAVDRVLSDLDLEPTRNLTVGNALNKTISGGQRKRLNIALELIREPSILIVDEPTSGLSSMDSDMVMSLLKEQTLKGKLVLVNIHQPSSDIYKLFDRLLMLDKGGFPVYYGNPVEAIGYFKHSANYVNANVTECVECGHVNPEQPLEILEAKVVDEHGRFTKERKVSTVEWYKAYKEKIESSKTEQLPENTKTELPTNYFKIPSGFKQFRIFATRNILSKFTDKQFLLITFLESPLLAIILGYFTKYISGTDVDPDAYVFAENLNLPAYMFMAVTVALFFGMTLSAEEIIKDQKILKREKFLNLSKISYLNSKIIVLFLISAIQTLSFILVGNTILGIKGMTMTYWLILFSTAGFANILGLNISSAFKSVVTIYITIPFILVPQLLFSGVIVDFTKLHKSFTTAKYVPVIGDIMTSRWAYEALAVAQYKDNAYEKKFFKIDMAKSVLMFKISYLLPELGTRTNTCIVNLRTNQNSEQTIRYLKILQNELTELEKDSKKTFGDYSDFVPEKFNESTAGRINNYLDELSSQYNRMLSEIKKVNDKIYATFIKENGGEEAVFKMKQDYVNKRLAEVVENKTDMAFIKEEDRRFIQMKDPIFKMPIANNGRAHFYAPFKKLGGIEIDTLWFNVGFIWFTSILIYFTLIFDIFSTISRIIEKFKK